MIRRRRRRWSKIKQARIVKADWLNDPEILDTINDLVELGYDAEEIIDEVYSLTDVELGDDIIYYIEEQIENWEKDRQMREARSIRRSKRTWQKDPTVKHLIERGAELGKPVKEIAAAVVTHLGKTITYNNREEVKNTVSNVWNVVSDYVKEYDAEREAYARRIAKKRHQRSCCGRGRPKRTARKWQTLPEGWDKESLESYWNSMGGSVDSCIEEISKDRTITDPGAFCASLADKTLNSTSWRHRPRKRRRK